MRRLLFLIHSDEPGGAETAFLQLVTGLARRGAAVTVGIAGEGWLLDRLRAARCDRLRVVSLRFRGPADGALLRAIVGLIRETRAELVQCFMSRMNLYGALAGAWARVPVVTSVRGAEGPGRWGQLPEWLVGRLSSRVVSVSDDLRRQLAGRLPEVKLVTIYNGVALERFAPLDERERAAVRSELGLPPDALLVGTVSRLETIKGVAEFVEAAGILTALGARRSALGPTKAPASQSARRLAPVLAERRAPSAERCFFLVIGDGSERDRLEALAAERGIAGRMRFVGLRDDVPRLVGALDLFVLPSTSEGLCNAILEAMAAGRPVIATNVGGNPELVRDGETGLLVPARDPQALAAAIGELLSDRLRARRLGDAGARRAAEAFALPRMVERFQGLYEEILSGHAERSAADPRICLVAPSLEARGGQAIQAATLVRRLRAGGWTVRHVAPDAELPRMLAWAAGVRGLRALLRQLAVLPGLARAVRSTDVVHVFTASYVSFWLTALPALFLARCFRRPVLLHYHSGEAEDHLRKWWYGAVPILRQVDHRVTPSAYLAELFARCGLPATVIPNVIDLAAFGRDRSVGSADESFPRLLCTRNFEPLYNVGCVLRAFARVREALPGATLTLVGSGSEEARLKALADDLGCGGVTFAGSVAPAEMPAYYAAADLFVNASDVDNMPVSILEAFAAGVPVVTTDAGGIPWLVRDGCTGLLVPRNDPSALAGAVLRLARDPAFARELSQRAREEVARCTWEAVGPFWRATYRSLASLRSERAARSTGVPAPATGPRGRGNAAPMEGKVASRLAIVPCPALRAACCVLRAASPRLTRMSPHEVFHRSRQAVRMRVDAAVATLRRLAPGAWRLAETGTGPDVFQKVLPVPGQAPSAKRQALPFWFHPGEQTERAVLLAARLPEAAARVLASADAALAGQVILFGHVAASLPALGARRSALCGDEDKERSLAAVGAERRAPSAERCLSWHRDPASGREWPRVFWTAIDPRPGNPIGDVKFVWELNRHAHFLSLAQAAVLTGKEEYALALASQMGSWMAQNPPGIGVNWTSSLEVALRALTWLWALHLAGDGPGFPTEARRDAVGVLRQSARHISRYLSVYTSPNTHLLGEALALWVIGIACPELAGAERFRRDGRAHLARTLLRQIRPDGGPIEQSASYHRYVLEMGLLALTLGEAVGERWPAAVWEGLEAAAAYAMHLTGPDGRMPPVGDCDGGRTLPFAERDPHDARGWLAVAAVLFGRGDMKQVAGAPSEELIWLLGARGLARWDALSVPDEPPGSAIFPQTGTVVMKAGGHRLVFDAGPHGFGRAGHGHADALAIDLSIHGEPVLVDPGTYAYGGAGCRVLSAGSGTEAASPLSSAAKPLLHAARSTQHAAPRSWRDAFRGATAHNTVIIDEAEPATPAGPFAWARRVEGTLVRAIREEQFDWAEGRHGGYHALGDPVSIRRKLLFCKAAYWVIEDIIDGCQEHICDLMFHLAHGASVSISASGDVHVRTAGAHSLWLIPLYREGIHVDVTTGQLSPPYGWVSPRYGERIAAPVVHFRRHVRAPAALYTLLVPGAPPNVEWLPARRDGRELAAAAAGGVILSTPGFQDLLLFRHDAGGAVELNGWETDAEAAVIREAPGAAPTTWHVGGSYVRKAALGAWRLALGPAQAGPSGTQQVPSSSPSLPRAKSQEPRAGA
jgi:glycosyltransferase involved in cell wall biosynthesis